VVLRDPEGRELCRIAISMASELPRRCERLLEVREGRSGVAARSLQLGLDRLRQLNGAQTFEMHCAALAELEELERLAAELEAGTAPFADGGDRLLELAVDPAKSLPARFFAPPRAEAGEEPARPLVIALHGMGGSEHIFFEASGAGRIVELARARGWLLVAPKVIGASDFVERVIDAVEELRPVDRQRVFLVGHSMGASRACGAVQRSPQRYRAVALFGGAGRLKDPAAAREVAFWVGVGTKDFARGGAVSFAKALEKAQHPRVVLREMPGVEHYTVMQLGLDEAFAFFDECAKRDG
jgi:predicted esterase